MRRKQQGERHGLRGPRPQLGLPLLARLSLETSLTFEKSLRETAPVALDGSVMPRSGRESTPPFCPTNQTRQREEPRDEARSQRRDMLRAEHGAIQEPPLKNQVKGSNGDREENRFGSVVVTMVEMCITKTWRREILCWNCRKMVL